MTATAQNTLTMPELAEQFGLPEHVIRRFVERHGLIGPRKYPRQHRSFDAARLPELRRLLKAEGYMK
jgi:DNA-binding transcriptional MerR regulator